ncbi:3-isopropylmalate dehydratase small subunit [Leptospira idonii]|uniref:3-isopropylmalate dehydratase small subunit n=1 Tax=Leptospira idonii TaxID=1193500 RepID=A0A4R9LYF1_9LEPT|nr:3-isopropylmalate dehydratase small subunit [Leptospira idonii]TGN18742.1 3-isopropylmalate dehydratase small subunit [Leptospira idonii]
MKSWKQHKGIAAVIDRNDIDTDQILPKQFMKLIHKQGFGDHLFFDWRYSDSEGKVKNPDFVLNRPPFTEATVLVSGSNFGCGSSREHAPWALAGFGFRAVLAASFADIFSINAPKNGIALIRLQEEELEEIKNFLRTKEGESVEIDLEQETVRVGGKDYSFRLEENAKQRIKNGWDDIDVTLIHKERIETFQQNYFETFPFYEVSSAST